MDNINWGELPFAYLKTDYNVRCYFRNGKWGKVEVSSSEYIQIETNRIKPIIIQYGFNNLGYDIDSVKIRSRFTFSVKPPNLQVFILEKDDLSQ